MKHIVHVIVADDGSRSSTTGYFVGPQQGLKFEFSDLGDGQVHLDLEQLECQARTALNSENGGCIETPAKVRLSVTDDGKITLSRSFMKLRERVANMQGKTIIHIANTVTSREDLEKLAELTAYTDPLVCAHTKETPNAVVTYNSYQIKEGEGITLYAGDDGWFPSHSVLDSIMSPLVASFRPELLRGSSSHSAFYVIENTIVFATGPNVSLVLNTEPGVIKAKVRSPDYPAGSKQSCLGSHTRGATKTSAILGELGYREATDTASKATSTCVYVATPFSGYTVEHARYSGVPSRGNLEVIASQRPACLFGKPVEYSSFELKDSSGILLRVTDKDATTSKLQSILQSLVSAFCPEVRKGSSEDSAYYIPEDYPNVIVFATSDQVTMELDGVSESIKIEQREIEDVSHIQVRDGACTMLDELGYFKTPIRERINSMPGKTLIHIPFDSTDSQKLVEIANLEPAVINPSMFAPSNTDGLNHMVDHSVMQLTAKHGLCVVAGSQDWQPTNSELRELLSSLSSAFADAAVSGSSDYTAYKIHGNIVTFVTSNKVSIVRTSEAGTITARDRKFDPNSDVTAADFAYAPRPLAEGTVHCAGWNMPEDTQSADEHPYINAAEAVKADLLQGSPVRITGPIVNFGLPPKPAALIPTEEHTGSDVNYYTVDIKHPKRFSPYTAECEDIIEALQMNFAEGSAFKAIWRSCAYKALGKKKKGGDGVYDAEKVAYYGQRMVAQRKRAADNVLGSPPAVAIPNSMTVTVASVANLSISTTQLLVDDHSLSFGDTVLLAGQLAKSENGVYAILNVCGRSSWIRIQESAEGTVYYVQKGSLYGGARFVYADASYKRVIPQTCALDPSGRVPDSQPVDKDAM